MANFTGIEILMLVTACIFIGAGVVKVFDMRFESGVDVQAMRFACINAGYVDLGIETAWHDNLEGKDKFEYGNYCAESKQEVNYLRNYKNYKPNNRVVLIGSKYVVQVKQRVTEWTTVQSKGVEE